MQFECNRGFNEAQPPANPQNIQER